MNRLFIFTAINPSFVAVWEGKTIYELLVHRGRGSKFLAKILNTFLVEYDEIWVSMGPGMFTGTRVGVAYALGLAAGLNLDHLYVYDTFDFLYAPYYGESMWVVIPARRGEVYAAFYEKGNKLEEGVYSEGYMQEVKAPILSYANNVLSTVTMKKISVEHVDALIKHHLYKVLSPEDVKVKYMKPITEEYRVYGKYKRG